ncbi:MAG TPA: ABC transporter permease, partial [Candidatus Acidoferrum sp.]|nr:ABC transporter permease [Candidatus Acidoferrum sp.]
MTRYLFRRLLYFVPVIFVVTLVVFSITMLLPGDPALAFLGEANIHDKVAYQAMRQELGLDRPLAVQYVNWVGRALRGDLGRSVRTHEAVSEALAARLPVTIELAAVALGIALLIAIPVGIISATQPNSKLDAVATVIAVSGVALPEFFVGIVLIYLFAVGLRLLPPSGYVPLSVGLWANLRSIILPALSLGLTLNAVTMRQTRASLLEVLQEEYVTVARSKGLPEGAVIRVHALKNALIPVITVIGLQVGRLFGGTVVVETIFAFPGM